MSGHEVDDDEATPAPTAEEWEASRRRYDPAVQRDEIAAALSRALRIVQRAPRRALLADIKALGAAWTAIWQRIDDALETARDKGSNAARSRSFDAEYCWWMGWEQFNALSMRAQHVYRMLWLSGGAMDRYAKLRYVEARHDDGPFEMTIDDDLMPELGRDFTRRDLAIARAELLGAGFLVDDEWEYWQLADAAAAVQFAKEHPRQPPEGQAP